MEYQRGISSEIVLHLPCATANCTDITANTNTPGRNIRLLFMVLESHFVTAQRSVRIQFLLYSAECRKLIKLADGIRQLDNYNRWGCKSSS